MAALTQISTSLIEGDTDSVDTVAQHALGTKAGDTNGNSIEGLYEQDFGGNAGLDWSGFIRPTDQYGRIGHMILMGNLISFNPRRHAVINGIT